MEAIRWARAVRNLDSTEKLILLLLADHANAEGSCWPSVAGLAADSCVAERTAQRALSSLEKAGFVERERKGGRSLTSVYRLRLDLSQRVTDGAERVSPAAPFSDPERVTNTTERVSSTTERVTPEVKRVTPVSPEPIEPSVTQEEKREGALRASPASRGTRLPKDWEPSVADCEFARSLSLDPRRVAASFRDYWHGAAGAKATKADWPATWRTWCRRDAERRPSRASQPQQPRRSVHDNIRWMFEPTRAASSPYDIDGLAEELPH